MKPQCKKLGRRAFVARIGAGGLTIVAANLTGSAKGSERVGATLESGMLRLFFDRESGSLQGIQNKLSNESLRVCGDEFAVVAEEFTLSPKKMRLVSLEKPSPEVVEATYLAEGRQVVASYKLGQNNHFVEKQLVITSPSSYRLKTLVVSKMGFSGSKLKMVKYPYQKNVAYFARSERGGILLGMELPFDTSSLGCEGMVTLSYQPSLKVKAHERLESEPLYLGVYKRCREEKEEAGLPLPSESEAMVAMTSAILGPPRHGLVALAQGWWSEMVRGPYCNEAQVESDMRSIDFFLECGIDWVGEAHIWDGEVAKINALREGDHYQRGPLVIKLLEYAAKKKVKMMCGYPITNTNPWYHMSEKDKGQPYRSDRPNWVMFPEGQTVFDPTQKTATGNTGFGGVVKGNCLASEPFYEWLTRLALESLETGYYAIWAMDGDFVGGQGFDVPANCPSNEHNHLPGDSNYGCERNLIRMMAAIRSKYPHIFIGPLGRPPMDFGIWLTRHADGVWPIDEFAFPEHLPGIGDQPLNVMMGDKLRKWARIRVHRHFFPHYMDMPLVFARPKRWNGPDWSSDKIDYAMLSALSCSPNSQYFLPCQTGIPGKDKAEIRKWLEWGRKNIRYLHVRRDLPQWPEAGKVDGSAHIVEDRGLIFLFNPNPTPLPGRFRLNERLGITEGSRFEIAQTYPASETKQQSSLGKEVVVEVAPHSAVVLSLAPVYM